MPGARTIINWLAVASIIGAFLLTMRSLPLDTATEALGRWLDSLGGWAPLAFGAVYAIATVFFLPGWILTIAAGAFFGPFMGTVTVSLGSTVGAALAFLIARYVLRGRVEQRVGDSPKLRALDSAIGEGGWKIVALLRLSPAIPFNLQNYLYGVTRIRFRPYVVTSWLAMLPATFMYVYVGHAAGAVVTDRRERSVAEWTALAVGLVATIAVTVYITRLARRKMQDQIEIDEDDGPREAATQSTAQAPSRWRPVVAAISTLLALTLAVFAHVRREQIESIVTGWLGPPSVRLAEAYSDHEDGPTFDHSDLTTLLARHVDDGGRVDYASLLGDEQQLDRYLDSLEDAPFERLGRDEKLALLLNAYNAFTLRLILDYWNDGALASIREIPAERRWQDRRWKIAGRTWSLDEIEHQQIRPKFREPRVHFALVCAAVGCPPLRKEAYDADRIGAQLEDQAQYVHRHGTWFQLDRQRSVVKLTPLYHWFAGDFEQVAGSAPAFAGRYSEDLERALDHGARLKIEWLEYDWNLNRSRARGRTVAPSATRGR